MDERKNPQQQPQPQLQIHALVMTSHPTQTSCSTDSNDVTGRRGAPRAALSSANDQSHTQMLSVGSSTEHIRVFGCFTPSSPGLTSARLAATPLAAFLHELSAACPHPLLSQFLQPPLY